MFFLILFRSALVCILFASSYAYSSNHCLSTFFEDRDVLYIGDSHSYLRKENGSRMGNEVIRGLKDCGARKVRYHAACGSAPRNWMPHKTPSTSCGLTTITDRGFSTRHRGKTENIATLQRRYNPDVIVINLGDNMFNWNRRSGRTRSSINSNNVTTQVQNLIRAIDNNRDCVWIGPTYHSPGKPYVKRDSDVDLMYTAISKGLLGKCRLIDSRDTFQQTKANDGLHLTASESNLWGLDLSRKFSIL